MQLIHSFNLVIIWTAGATFDEAEKRHSWCHHDHEFTFPRNLQVDFLGEWKAVLVMKYCSSGCLNNGVSLN